ncbi:MAG: 16S rRNA processing protein RimM [Anaerolineales bacterium]|nr:MAG: 16S rRNA processing protein RimM [Anaerolineales bacterium]
MQPSQPSVEERRRGSDGTVDSSEPRFIAIGRIIRPHGVRGEVSVEVLTDFPERFDTLEVVHLGEAMHAEPWQITASRWHKDHVLLTLQGCEDRTSAQRLRGLLVQIPIEEAMGLPEDEYYPHQLIGLDVVTVEGEELGRISEILYTNANDVYVVIGPRGQILLPAIAEVIECVDLDAGQMRVRLMEGLV